MFFASLDLPIYWQRQVGQWFRAEIYTGLLQARPAITDLLIGVLAHVKAYFCILDNRLLD
jgi:hypothetical protein